MTCEEKLEKYLSAEGIPFDRHPSLGGVGGPKPDFLVRHRLMSFLLEAKDIETHRVDELLGQKPGVFQHIPQTALLGRARTRIIGALEKQLRPYAVSYPLVVALADDQRHDADLTAHEMLEILMGRHALVYDQSSREFNYQPMPDRFHGLYAMSARPSDAPRTRRFSDLASVIVMRADGRALSAYLNPFCETLSLDPRVFTAPEDEVWEELDADTYGIRA